MTAAQSEVGGGASSRTEEGQGVEEKIWWRKSSWSNVAGDWRCGEEDDEGVKREEEFMASDFFVCFCFGE